MKIEFTKAIMKRPFCAVGFTLFAVLCVLMLAENLHFTAAVCAVSVFLFILSMLIKKTRQTAVLPTVFASAAAACLLLFAFAVFFYDPAVSLVNDKTSVMAEITDYPVLSSGRYHCMARIKDVPGSPSGAAVRLSFSASSRSYISKQTLQSLEPGDTVSFEGKIYLLGESSSEVRKNFESKKIFLGAYPTDEVNVYKARIKPLSYYLKHERQKTINQLLYFFDGDTAGVAISVLLGDKTYLDDDLYRSVRASGVSHVMAVSGMHLSVWVLFIMNIAKYADLRERKLSVVMMLFVFLVMSFACFSGSVVRAGIMMLVYLFGFLIRRRSDPLNSLGFAVTLMLILNPYSCMNVSFILSFISTLVIIVFVIPICERIKIRTERFFGNKKCRKVADAVIDCVVISVFVSLFTMPVVVYFFSEISVFGLLTNLLILPVTVPMIVSLGLFIMFYHIAFISDIFCFAANVFTKYFIAVTKLIGSRSCSTVSFSEKTVCLLLASAVISFAAVYAAVRYRKKALSIAASCIVVIGLFSSVVFDLTLRQSTVSITVFAVGEGLCVSASQGKSTVLAACELDDYYVDFTAGDIELISSAVDTAIVSDIESCNLRLLSALLPKRIITGEDINSFPVKLRSACDEKTMSCSLRDALIEEDGKAVYIKAFGVTVAVTKEADVTADIIITNNEAAALDIAEKSVIILSGKPSGLPCISTGEFENISVCLSDGGRYYVKGENRWLYLTKSN